MPGGLGSTHKVLILGKGVGTPALQGLFLPDARHMNLTAWIGLGRHDRLRSRDARAHRAVLVVEHADRLDRVHPVRRRHRLARARQLVDPIESPRVRGSWRSCRFRCGWCSKVTTCSFATGTTSACPRTSRCGCSGTRGRSRRSGRRSSKARSWSPSRRGTGRTGGERLRTGRTLSDLRRVLPFLPFAAPVDRRRRPDARRRRFSCRRPSRPTWRRPCGSASSFCSIRSTRGSAASRWSPICARAGEIG